MRKCNHMTSRFTWREVKYGAVAVSRWCIECGVMLSMGPSNDAPVWDEMRAAEIAADLDPDSIRTGERWGWLDHDDPAAFDLDNPSLDCSMEWGWYAGWLAREITTHDDREVRDADAWPWDPTRQIAEQWPNVPASEDGIPPSFRTAPEPAIDLGDDPMPDPSAGYDGQGACEHCGVVVADGDQVYAYDDDVVTHVNCPTVGAERPTGDPLDAETRKEWNADLDAMERGS